MSTAIRILESTAIVLFAAGAGLFVPEESRSVTPPPNITIARLEAHAAAGSSKSRDDGARCRDDERRRLAELDELEAGLFPETSSLDPALAAPLADAIEQLRACVSCAPIRTGCADAVRSLARAESRLRIGGTLH